jgi:lipoyl(octanoyl) transferase
MNLVVRQFGLADYTRMLERMREFVDSRSEDSVDEIWFLEHPPVFTQGQGGRAVHIHDAGDIPVVQSDRGGQVTYHGPGQLVAYILMDLRRQGLGPRELVRRIEQGVIALLETLGVSASRRPGAPGVYVLEAKIAALGLRIRRGTSYHGLSLNVNLDLGPFTRIDPCGYRGLEVTRLSDFGIDIDCVTAAERLLPKLVESLYGHDALVAVDYRSGAGNAPAAGGKFSGGTRSAAGVENGQPQFTHGV